MDLKPLWNRIYIPTITYYFLQTLNLASFQKLNVTWIDLWICILAANVCAELRSTIFCYKSVISMIWEVFFEVYYMSIGQKLPVLKICLTIVTLIILKLETFSVWKIWVLEVLTSHCSDTMEGRPAQPNRVKCEFKKFSRPLWSLSAKLKGRCILRSILHNT